MNHPYTPRPSTSGGQDLCDLRRWALTTALTHSLADRDAFLLAARLEAHVMTGRVDEAGAAASEPGDGQAEVGWSASTARPRSAADRRAIDLIELATVAKRDIQLAARDRYLEQVEVEAIFAQVSRRLDAGTLDPSVDVIAVLARAESVVGQLPTRNERTAWYRRAFGLDAAVDTKAAA